MRRAWIRTALLLVIACAAACGGSPGGDATSGDAPGDDTSGDAAVSSETADDASGDDAFGDDANAETSGDDASGDDALGDDAAPPDTAVTDTATTDAPVDAPTGVVHAWDIGMNEWVGDFDPFIAFRVAENASPAEPRLCHAYTYWNVARADPPNGDQTHKLASFIQWFGTAQRYCDDVLVTFQGAQSTPESPPSTAQFDAAFQAFLHLADPGQPLAAWHGKLSFTAWNEPNNANPSGSGLTAPMSPELAAQYYLIGRSHCSPTSGCRMVAGDFATNGGTANDIELNCADDNDPANTTTRCARPSTFNPTNKPPSYLDRYKNYIALHATTYGLPSGFRPEYFAIHPWHDVNAYIESNIPCSTYQNCSMRRLLTSLGGTWGGVEIWDDEIGVGLQTNPAPDPNTTQPCGAAFLVRLTNLQRRTKRLYYMRFASTNGPLFNGTTLRPAGRVLADRAITYSGASCAPTGM